MAEPDFEALSDYEKRIVRELQSREGWTAIEEISALTGIPLDIVVTACVWLAQHDWLVMDRRPDPADLELQLSQDARQLTI